MKKKKNKIQQCHNENCGLYYDPQSKKSKFCSDSCRAEHGQERRRKRDKTFNLMIKNLKKWYLTLLKFESGSVVEMATLNELGLDRAFLPPARYNKKWQYTYTLGQVKLTQIHDNLYEITHNEEGANDHSVRLEDTQKSTPKYNEQAFQEVGGIIKTEPPKVEENNKEKEALNKMITDMQAEIVKLKTENQVKLSKEKIERTQNFFKLMKKPVVHINELMPLQPIIDTWNGTATIDGVIFKKAYMHSTNYRFIHTK